MLKAKKVGTSDRFNDLDVVNDTDISDAERKEFAPKDEVTEIVCIIDRSGSMDSIKEDAIGGFNSFLAEQKKDPGEAIMTVALFDHEYILLQNGTPIQQVPPLNESTYVPRGATALLDAIGNTVTALNVRNPKKAIIMILTDGQENASTKYQKQQIKDMIDASENKGWFVAYISANMDAIADARSVGIGMAQTMRFSGDSRGTQVAYMAANMATHAYRSRSAHGMSLGASMPSMATFSAQANTLYNSQQGMSPLSGNDLKVTNEVRSSNPFTTSNQNIMSGVSSGPINGNISSSMGSSSGWGASDAMIGGAKTQSSKPNKPKRKFIG